MKNISRSTITILTILLFTHGISSDGSTVIGDIIIESRNGSIYCDSMICPPGAVACHVIKRNDPNDYSRIVRNRKCIAPNGAILAQETTYEPNPYQGNVNINVVSGGGGLNVGRELTPQEQRELEEYLKQTQDRIQSQVADTLSQVYESIRPFQDGSFSANLRNRIQAEVRDNLNNALKY